MACFLYPKKYFQLFSKFGNILSLPPRYYIEGHFEKAAISFINIAPTLSKKVTTVTSVTGKTVFIKTIVTAVTSVTEMAKFVIKELPPLFQIPQLNIAITYIAYDQTDEKIAALFLCKKFERSWCI